MLFNSYTFLVFFACLLLLYQLPAGWHSRKWLLLIASYLFYAAWSPKFVTLLWLSTLVDWFAAKWIAVSSRPLVRRAFLAISLVVNLGLLATFKYGNFVVDNITTVLAAAGFTGHPTRMDLILPVGISFYTFQTLSYTIDVYRGLMQPARSLLDFALYVTFFPQLVAGPIVRAVDFLPQCIEPLRRTWRQFSWGLALLTIGLFEKTVIADHFLAPIVERVYDRPQAPTAVAAWTGTLAFAGQIFCDFAGYSTCAIGVAICLGFSLPDNFRFPYAATGFSDFWNRWHISLSSWLRDYLYIPMGGNRRGSVRTHANLLVTMLLGGLWHGASWTFVAWGALHGLYLVAERLLKRTRLAGRAIWKLTVGQIGIALVTFVFVNIAWVFFRARTFESAFSILGSMFGQGPTASSLLSRSDVLWTMLIISGIVLTHWTMRHTTIEAVAARTPPWVLALAGGAMIAATTLATGEDRAFIYFQF